jgi:hypothetical protein
LSFVPSLRQLASFFEFGLAAGLRLDSLRLRLSRRPVGCFFCAPLLLVFHGAAVLVPQYFVFEWFHCRERLSSLAQDDA